MSWYTKEIMRICHVDQDDASEIEEIMRYSKPTLDHLTMGELIDLARDAKLIWQNYKEAGEL